jgi:hypothetical protein
MKKQVYLLLLASLLFSISSADAQFHSFRKNDRRFGVGIKAGLNYANQSTSNSLSGIDVSSVIGINGGVYCNYFLLDFLAVQPELMVSGKGVHWKDQYYDASDVLTYIDMPILLKYQPVKILNIHAGPEFGYNLIAKQKNMENGQKTDIKDYYNDLDVALAMGIEATFPIRVNLTLRYVLGLKSATSNNTYNEEWKNNFFQISLGYRFFGK